LSYWFQMGQAGKPRTDTIKLPLETDRQTDRQKPLETNSCRLDRVQLVQDEPTDCLMPRISNPRKPYTPASASPRGPSNRRKPYTPASASPRGPARRASATRQRPACVAGARLSVRLGAPAPRRTRCRSTERRRFRYWALGVCPIAPGFLAFATEQGL
jgi:hypothetical protein